MGLSMSSIGQIHGSPSRAAAIHLAFAALAEGFGDAASRHLTSRVSVVA